MDKLFQSSVKVCGLQSTRQVLPALEFVRWRKPRWVPRAKSREFVLFKRHEYDPEETEWLRTTENHYRTKMKAIWQLIKLVPEQSLPDKKMIMKKVHKEKLADASWKEMEDRVNEWNKRIAVIREPEQNKLEKARQLRIYKLLDQEQIISEQFSKETLKRLEREKEVGFITPENMDQKLAESLETTVDYEFAIDREGVRVIKFDADTKQK